MTAVSNTTIPVCFSCAPRAGCCNFRSTVCVTPEPQTLEDLLAVDPFAQILLVMCTHGYLWNPCCGPVGSTNVGFTTMGLLVELQQEFPDSNWNEENLATFLEVGILRGILKESSDNTWYANQNLLNVNPRNWRYEIVCPQFCAKKGCKLNTDRRQFT